MQLKMNMKCNKMHMIINWIKIRRKKKTDFKLTLIFGLDNKSWTISSFLLWTAKYKGVVLKFSKEIALTWLILNVIKKKLLNFISTLKWRIW